MRTPNTKALVIARCMMALLVLASLGGCALQKIKREVETAEKLGLLTGSVVSKAGTEGVLVALFMEGDEGLTISGVAELSELQQTWGFLGDAHHRYYFAAFHDLDGDRIRDPDEPAAFFGDEREIRIQAGGKHLGIQLKLSATTTIPERFVLDLSSEKLLRQSALHFAVGEVVSLDDERFAVKRASEGLWQPLTQITKQSAGLYFLEPYDPDRIPVVFIHGIGGTPLDSRVLIERLDKTKFQAWIYFYPSGFRLTTISKAVSKRLVSLKETLNLETIYVVAHSMGGLVAKGLILDLVANPKTEHLVKLFATFATPIEGHSAAAQGLRFTPEPVPAWFDMAPGSPYLTRIKAPLPDYIPYYIFYGYDRSGNFFMRRSHDSVVDVDTQIPLWAQDQATWVRGFNLDHMTILSDEEPVSRFLEILDASLEP